MILALLVLGPLVGGFVAWLFGRAGRTWVRIWPLLFLLLDFAVLLAIWIGGDPTAVTMGSYHFYDQLLLPWIPQLGISVHLVLDGLSLLLALLTVFIGIVVIVVFWRRERESERFFYFNLSLVLAGVLGTFLAVDLFLFFLFWELMLVPMYFLIVGWGGERRERAGFKFFVFTQFSGLLMLLAILALYFIHGASTGSYTFDLFRLLGTPMSSSVSMLLLLGFLAAFMVKLPVVPFHSWLPDAYTEAPIEGTIILAALLSKTAAYGILRFAIPLFPQAVASFAPVAFTLGVVSVIYGAVLAFAQTDLKRLVAYTSVSHLGFVFVGLFALTPLALQGSVLLMLSHGVATGGLFIVVGLLEQRLGSRSLDRMGGLFSVVPRLGGAGFVLGLVALGVPGSGNFISEILVIIGTFKASVVFAVILSAGLIFSVAYALWMIQRAFHGKPASGLAIADLSGIETASALLLILVVFWLGLYPQPIFNTAHQFLQIMQGGI